MARNLQVDLQLNIDNARRQLNAFSSDAQKAFKSQGQNSPAYQQAAQQAAQQRVAYRDALSQQSAFNKALQDEAKLRQQNMQATQKAQQQYSPAARTLTNALPGGNILGSGLSIGGMAALAGASAVAAAVAAVGAEFNKLGDRAKELASTSSNASSQLGQLRVSMERNKISGDIAATSPGVVGFQKFISDIGTNLDDFISHAGSNSDERAKAVKEKISGGLGQGNEDWRRLKEQGTDLAQDQSIARTAMQVKYQRQARDFDLEQRKFQVDTANQVFDLQKQAGRQQFDQQVAVQKFQENFANKQSQKAYDLSRQFATQSFAISQGRAVQDYSINRADKQADFSKSIKDQTFDYNLNKSRSMEDRNIQIQDMALGGASGLDYFRAARSYNLQQSRAAQDFQISQGRETRDFGIGQGRDARNFGISQGRATQDFQQQAKEALASRQLELEAQDYARKYEGLELQTQINRQSQDLAISFQRLNQSIGFQQQGFANQRSDMAYDKNLDYSNFALQTGRQNRNYGYAQIDFASQARNNDPLGALGLSMKDPSFAKALADQAAVSGMPTLQKQIQDALDRQKVSFGAQAGDFINTNGPAIAGGVGAGSVGLADTKGWKKSRIPDTGAGNYYFDDKQMWARIASQAQGLAAKGLFSQGGNNGGAAPNITITGGSNNIQLDPGLTGQIQQAIDDGDKKTQENVLDILRKYYSG